MPKAVLIHGGLHGGWCWNKVRGPLEEAGWTIYTPSLSGLGDRAHLASPDITLQTHVQDVVALIQQEDLTGITLCGHSAAGMVITGVADAVPDRLHTLVYLDAVVPNDGESLFDIVGPAMTAVFRQRADERGQGWLVPTSYFSAAADFGVTDPSDALCVEQNLTGHPIRAFADPLPVAGGVSQVANKIYVRCTEHRNRPHLDKALDSVSGRPGWTVHRWPSAHDVMITEPDRLCDLFIAIAATQTAPASETTTARTGGRSPYWKGS
jgi:pimeloyl-ACP methyl ester carboxylesterase